MSHGDLHSALKTHLVGDFAASGIGFKHVRLQHGKTSFTETLHARPTGWTTYGVQATDYLHFLGFRRSRCQFQQGECYCREISPTVNPGGLTAAIGQSLEQFKQGARSLGECGIHIAQPEGWGYFFGRGGDATPRGVHLTFSGWATDRQGLAKLLRIFRTVRFEKVG